VALAAESAGSVLFRPAAQAHIPALVGRGRLLSSANSLSAVTDGTVRLIGAPLGAALLVAVGFPYLIVADAVSYLISALAILLTSRRSDVSDRPRTTARQIGIDLREGLDAVWRRRMARGLLLVSTVFLAANASLSALLVPFGVTRLGGAEQTGFVVSALGVGFLVGAPVIRALVDRVQPRYLLAANLFCTAVGFYLLFSSTSLVAALPAAVAIGVFGSMTLVTPQTTLQRVLPDAVLGRVGSVFLTGEALATLVGSVAGPTLGQAAGIAAVTRVACATTVLTALLCLVLLPTTATMLPPGRRRGGHAGGDTGMRQEVEPCNSSHMSVGVRTMRALTSPQCGQRATRPGPRS
jgi:predicted MFS family arabinose efflux permease